MVQSGDYTRDDLKVAAIENDTNKYSIEDNTITLTGTHVSDGGKRTEISKTVYLTNDWYGTTQASIYTTVQKYDNLQDVLDEENQKVTLSLMFILERLKNNYYYKKIIQILQYLN